MYDPAFPAPLAATGGAMLAAHAADLIIQLFIYYIIIITFSVKHNTAVVMSRDRVHRIPAFRVFTCAASLVHSAADRG